MSSCQKDVKCQTSGLQKRENIDTIRFTDIDVNFDITYEGHQNWSKILSLHILSVLARPCRNWLEKEKSLI